MLNLTEKKMTSDEQAVSEVMGGVLLVGIVVIMLSVLGVSVFAQDGPDDVPHTNVQEIMDISTDTIYLKHSGGEPISTKDAEIIVNINGRKYEYNSSQIYENLGNNSVWKIGDTIEINTMSTWTVNLQNNDRVELFLVDTPSNELIQKSRLTTRFQKEPKFAMTLTPMGDITDTSISGKDASKKGYGDKKQVSAPDSNTADAVGDDNENKNCTTYYPSPKNPSSDTYQIFDFGIKPMAYGVRPGDTFCNVTLVIVYYVHDTATKDLKIKFYDTDEYGHGEWVYKDLDETATSKFVSQSINLTDYINTPADLENFKVQIEAFTQAASEKAIHIDYIGLWIEEDNTESE